MKTTHKPSGLTYQPYVELPDYLIRYLIKRSDGEPIASLNFSSVGDPRVQYLLDDLEFSEYIKIFYFVREKRKQLFGITVE